MIRFLEKHYLKFLSLYLIFLLLIIFWYVYYSFYKLDDDVNWYTDNALIGHALYGIDEVSYTNSYEAMVLGYEKGIRVMEADFLLTGDKELILNHFWDNSVISYDEFMNKKINGIYTSMDIDMLLDFLEAHEDLYIIVDTKENYYSDDYLEIYEIIVSKCLLRNDELLNRFIIQIYDMNEYKAINKIYSFNNYIFSLYKLEKFSLKQIIYFCLSKKIDVIAIPLNYLEEELVSEDDIEKMKKKNFKVFVYTVNDEEEYDYLKSIGIDGIYTDFIS